MSTLGLIFTRQVGITQVSSLNFNSLCRLDDGTVIGVNDSGAFILDSWDDDNGDDIDAFFEIAETDLGLANQKRIRKAIVSGESSGPLLISVKGDEGSFIQRSLDVDLDSSREEGVIAPIGREVKGRFLTVRIDNIGGCDFSIDSIDLDVKLLSSKAGRVHFFLPFFSETFPSLTCEGTGS